MELYKGVMCPGNCASLVQAVNHRIASHYYRAGVPCDGSGQQTRIAWAPYWVRQSIRANLLSVMLGLGSKEFECWVVPEVYWLHNRKEVHA